MFSSYNTSFIFQVYNNKIMRVFPTKWSFSSSWIPFQVHIFICICKLDIVRIVFIVHANTSLHASNKELINSIRSAFEWATYINMQTTFNLYNFQEKLCEKLKKKFTLRLLKIPCFFCLIINEYFLWIFSLWTERDGGIIMRLPDGS